MARTTLARLASGLARMGALLALSTFGPACGEDGSSDAASGGAQPSGGSGGVPGGGLGGTGGGATGGAAGFGGAGTGGTALAGGAGGAAADGSGGIVSGSGGAETGGVPGSGGSGVGGASGGSSGVDTTGGVGGAQPTGGSGGSGGTAGTGEAGAGGATPGGGTGPTGGGAGAGGSGTGGAWGGSGGGSATGGSAGAGGTAGTGGSSPSDILAPESGALLGIFYGDESIQATGVKVGRVPPLHLTYYAFEDDWTRGPTRDDLDAGRIPFVNWELFGATLDDIVAGVYDDMLEDRAAAAAVLGERFFLDFGAEMNGEWSPWGGAQNGESADRYVAAYQHVHDAMVAGGATNLVWAWCPNVTDEPREAWNAAMNYYPGDSYVDWTCVDGYNWGAIYGDWQTFHEVFENIYPILAAVGKPIMIGEMASTEEGGDKAAWIDGMVPALRDSFPMIKGLIWFDIDKETDWRISSSSGSEQAFARMAADPYMNP